MTHTKWDIRHVQLAQYISAYSKDDSTKVGCVIVGEANQILSTGFNGFPRNINEVNADGSLIGERWHNRPQKYQWIEHAERNAIYNAARHGISLSGAVAYLSCEPSPCTDCLRAFIQSGIKKIVGVDIPFEGKGKGTHYDIHNISHQMREESGIEVLYIQRDAFGK